MPGEVEVDARRGEDGRQRLEDALARAVSTRRGGRIFPLQPFAQPVLELHTRPLLCMFAIKARLQHLAGSCAAGETHWVVTQVQRLPAAIELDNGRKDRTGLARQCLQLRHNDIRFGRAAFSILDRIEPFPRQPRHTAISILGGVGELAQSVRGANVLGGSHARLRVLGRERELDE